MKVEEIPAELLRVLRGYGISETGFQPVNCALSAGIPEAVVQEFLERIQQAGWVAFQDENYTWYLTEEGRQALAWKPTPAMAAPTSSRAGTKYQVFISSTFDDLRDERERLIWELQKGGKFIPAGMEMFPTRSERGWEIIQNTIDQSDYYVLVVGGKYGSVDGDLSWTEREYEYALSKGVPVFHFIRDPDSIQGVKNVEQDSTKKTKLDAFKERLKVHLGTQEPWTNADNLVTKVLQALDYELTHEPPRPGWVRGGATQAVLDLEQENERLKAEVTSLRQERRVPSESDSAPPLVDEVVTAIEDDLSKKGMLLKRYLEGLLATLDQLNPPHLHQGKPPDEVLLEALETTLEPLSEYSRVCRVVSEMDAKELTPHFVAFFENLLWVEKRWQVAGFNSQISKDYFSFLAHETFVMFIATLLEDQRFAWLGDVFSLTIHNRRSSNPDGTYTQIHGHAKLLNERADRLDLGRHRVLQAELLRDRHTSGPLSDVCPFERFLDADLLAFFHSILSPPETPYSNNNNYRMWMSWSTRLAAEHVPEFLTRSRSKGFADKIRVALGLQSADEFKDRWAERHESLGKRWDAWAEFREYRSIAIAENP